jgi:translation initiation factor IF-3
LHDIDPNLVRNLNHIPEQVRLVDVDKTWLASRSEVQARIRETNLDLYLINKEVSPPVYKMLDYGRFRFDKQKKDREHKKKMREQNRPMKEFKFKPGIDDHDVETKLHHIRENLPECDVKICMDLKGRGGSRQNAFILTNRWTRSIESAVAEPNFVLNRVLGGLLDLAIPTRINITDNQIYAVVKYNGEVVSD